MRWTERSHERVAPDSIASHCMLLSFAMASLVEDNERNRDMLSRRLTKRGYEVSIAMDGVEGVEKARTTRPDIVLMDMSLPLKDGWEAQNMLLDAAGTLKVMDFGFAVLAQRTSTLTQAGMVVGTPTYMAPDQLLDEDSDARSDLYSAGVLL